MSATQSQSRVTTVPGQTVNKGITWPAHEWADDEIISSFTVDDVTPKPTPQLAVTSLGQDGQVGQIRIVADPNQDKQTYIARGTAITSAAQVLLWSVPIDVVD